MNKCNNVGTYDDINFVVVTIGYENNMFLDDSLSSLNDFNKKNNCECLFVCVDNNIYMADYVNDTWNKNTHTQKEYDLAIGVLNIMKVENFIVFKMICNKDYSDALKLLANIEDLNICRIWTCDKVDFKSLRNKFSAVFANYDAEAG
jgi:hypothetical protein